VTLGSANLFMVFAAATFVQIRICEHLKNLFAGWTFVLIQTRGYDKMARIEKNGQLPKLSSRSRAIQPFETAQMI
jgi:hypothetical protein